MLARELLVQLFAVPCRVGRREHRLERHGRDAHPAKQAEERVHHPRRKIRHHQHLILKARARIRRLARVLRAAERRNRLGIFRLFHRTDADFEPHRRQSNLLHFFAGQVIAKQNRLFHRLFPHSVALCLVLCIGALICGFFSPRCAPCPFRSRPSRIGTAPRRRPPHRARRTSARPSTP